MTEKAVRDVVIVGGGTAGWLTAGILAADHRAAFEDGLRVTLVESPTIPILGVGEGTWPSLRDTLRRIGIGETDFIRQCNASFKQGSRFDGWVNGAADDVYFHPFEAPPSFDDIDPLALWRAAPAGTPFAEAISHQAALCLAGRAPKQIVTPEYAAVANYAYHLDAPAFAAMLRAHCTQKLGVRLITDDMVDVVIGDDGTVESLVTKASGHVAGDLFVDCTGTRALLIGKALGVEAKSVGNFLFNDRALALHAPYEGEQAPIASQTTATAMPAGWIWDIALQTRRGIGYVYSSAYTSEDAARADLSTYLHRAAPASGVSGADARLIKFSGGYRETPWVGNVVAIGMAQGFVEPLEASAIVMIELSAMMLSDTLPAWRGAIETASARFNQRFAYRWSRIVDFLKLHYVLSRRPGQYWADNRKIASWPERLRRLVAQWKFEAPSREDFPQILEIFPAVSYVYILYGMGFETAPRRTHRRKDSPAIAERHLRDMALKRKKFLDGLPSNRELIGHIQSRGLTRI
ncbi:MAG: tryptophan 7-halogenase [Alphaproteobacteria bacterium]|nr:MAG: tryptophan 7-halogenase [Alphaproteobacteria bacterium]